MSALRSAGFPACGYWGLSSPRFQSKGLRPKFIKHLRVRLHQANKIFRVKHAERTCIRARLREAVELVRAAQFRMQQHRLRMPRMAVHCAWCGMVARDRDYVRFFAQ